MTTAILLFLLKKIFFYGMIRHISINGTALAHCQSEKRNHRIAQASLPGGYK
jgi:hypothetical protein